MTLEEFFGGPDKALQNPMQPQAPFLSLKLIAGAPDMPLRILLSAIQGLVRVYKP